MPVEENVRISITLSPDEYRNLVVWARYHGKPPTTYAGQIIGARVEANLDEIYKKLVPDAARARGISEDELIKEWISDGDK